SMIGSLMYLTASRPDIMFAVCACARFQVTPKASHLNAVKRIFRYITAKVAGKPVTISKASIRSDLLFYDAHGIDSMHNQAIFDDIHLMGSSKSTSWDQIPTNIATAPDPSPRPSPTIPNSIPEGYGGNHGGQSSSDRSLSGNENGLTLQSVYDLCVSLCKQVTDQAKEIKHLKAHIKKLKKKAKPVITYHKAWIKSEAAKHLAARLSEETKRNFTVEEIDKFMYDTKAAQNRIFKDPKKKRVVNETPREEDTTKVPVEQEVTERGTKKRKSGHVKMIARKRPRPQPDDEHRKCLRIVTFKSTIDSEIMETKSFVSNVQVSSPDGDLPCLSTELMGTLRHSTI
ncbi:hypothetical protein Tco_1206348, partial [Tanacetum coccineum]